jgi:hypothetical protein
MGSDAARLGHAGYEALIQDAIERAAPGDTPDEFVARYKGMIPQEPLPKPKPIPSNDIDQKVINQDYQNANLGLRQRLLQQGVPLDQVNQLYDEQGNLK